MSEIKRLAGNTIEITLELAEGEVTRKYESIFNRLLGEVEISGFRKGKAPKELAAKQVNPQVVYEESLKELIPPAYAQAIQEHGLKPIVSPKIELLEAEKGKPWKVKITVCERPIIVLKDYRSAISALYKSGRASGGIWTPDKDTKPEAKKDDTVSVGQVLDALYSAVTVELSDMLLEQETNRMLSSLVSDLQKLGLTVEGYLTSQGKSEEQLKREYKESAHKNLSLEFALEEVAEKEKIVVADTDIESFINQAKTPQEKENLSKQRYYIASVLRKQKTLAELSKPPVVTAA